jgi:hypothetical protein
VVVGVERLDSLEELVPVVVWVDEPPDDVPLLPDDAAEPDDVLEPDEVLPALDDAVVPDDVVAAA